ncbi:M20/M25/M40 family metallo-hydrolase [Roseovarius sp. LXJ103]|uniref:M20/M25/M40 family metallo-hydrolase n=1 Tax=Roseovarius carneus TaxID=2853164 RepID=UPI000D6090A7|nr:M20/M25/M40 family metallo-hydrolase [Roseovarius carneus]MBZ8119539.1 M20/M25/M40 family metallo-hydrolase [Roseovarius carneus]PWE34835.1 peptidase [Pelagicola sp. LXJ1103]
MDTHESGRQAILSWLDNEREEIIALLQALLCAPSPNPPGNTLDVAEVVKNYLNAAEIEHRVINPHPEMPNIVAAFDGGSPGRHLVLNGHMDVFPVAEGHAGWTHDPWAGDINEGRIFGRGACDMKPGTTASIVTYCLLYRLREQIKGRLTLTCVSDEETFGPWGARYLMEHHPELHGDCLLNGEPGGPESIRFGERGPLWVEFTVKAKGAHGAYVHITESATKIAMAVARDLEELTELEGTVSDNVASAIEAGRGMMDRMMGKGAGDLVSRVTLNIGLMNGGAKANMIPSDCRFTADLRLPLGMDKTDLLPLIEEIAQRHPGVEWEVIGGDAPSWCDPHHEMVGILQDNVEAFGRPRPSPIVSLGGTDARLWRHAGVPAYVYGPYPHGMGSHDEHVEIEEFLHVVRTHALSAWDYLSRPGA